MGNKRTGTYKKTSYKRRIQNLRGCNAAPVASTWVEAVGEKEVNDEKEKGVEDKFPILCLECSVQMPSSPPTEDDWRQVETPLSTKPIASEPHKELFDSPRQL